MDLQFKEVGNKQELEDEPPCFNTEAIKTARVLLREASSFQHDADLTVQSWKHVFVWVPAELVVPKMLEDKFPKIYEFREMGQHQ